MSNENVQNSCNTQLLERLQKLAGEHYNVSRNNFTINRLSNWKLSGCLLSMSSDNLLLMVLAKGWICWVLAAARLPRMQRCSPQLATLEGLEQAFEGSLDSPSWYNCTKAISHNNRLRPDGKNSMTLTTFKLSLGQFQNIWGVRLIDITQK